MPLMFLLSGLFVLPSLSRKGAQAYLLDRLRRLGLPFTLAVLTIMPLAYYPSHRMTGADIGFGAFWVQTVCDGPWPAGPAWFLAVLLGFDLTAVAVLPLLRRIRPNLSFGVLIAVSAVAYLPMLIGFGPSHWFAGGRSRRRRAGSGFMPSISSSVSRQDPRSAFACSDRWFWQSYCSHSFLRYRSADCVPPRCSRRLFG